MDSTEEIKDMTITLEVGLINKVEIKVGAINPEEVGTNLKAIQTTAIISATSNLTINGVASRLPQTMDGIKMRASSRLEADGKTHEVEASRIMAVVAIEAIEALTMKEIRVSMVVIKGIEEEVKGIREEHTKGEVITISHMEMPVDFKTLVEEDTEEVEVVVFKVEEIASNQLEITEVLLMLIKVSNLQEISKTTVKPHLFSTEVTKTLVGINLKAIKMQGINVEDSNHTINLADIKEVINQHGTKDQLHLGSSNRTTLTLMDHRQIIGLIHLQ